MAYNIFDDEINPQFPQQPQQRQQPQMGLLDRIMGGVKNFTSDDEKMARLAMAFNSMRITPDQGLQSALADRAKTAKLMKLSADQANKTAEFFRSQNRPDLAEAVEKNPTLAKDLLTEFYKAQFKGGGVTEATQSKMQQAQLAGLQPNTPEYEAFMRGGDSPEQSNWNYEKELRSEFKNDPNVKYFSGVGQAFTRMVESTKNPSAAGDLALIFNYMKMLDPSSTVREGEFASAQNAGGIDSSIVNLYNQLRSGERLSDSQRQDFFSRAQMLYKGAQQDYQNSADFYMGRASDLGLDPSKVFPSYGFTGELPTFTPQSDGPKLPDGVIMNSAGKPMVLFNGKYYTEEELQQLKAQQIQR